MSNDGNIFCQDLSAWLDGELEQPRRQQVADALQADPALREELDELQTVRQMVRALPREKAPGDFVARVLAEAERGRLFGSHHARRESAFLRWARYASVAAVLLVAASVGFVVYFSLWQTGGPRSNMALLGPREDAAERADKARESDRVVAVGGHKKAYGKADDGLDGEGIGRGIVADGGTVKTAGGAFGKAGGGGAGAGGGTGVALGVSLDTAAKIGDSIAGVQRFGQAVCEVGKEVIYTDRLEVTRRQVESILVSNGIQSAEQPPAKGGREAVARDIASRGNFYRADQLAANTVEYEVFVTPEQLAGVQNGLDSIRGRQRVSQATEETGADAPLREKSDSTAGRHGKSGELRGDDKAKLPSAEAAGEATPEDPKAEGLGRTGEPRPIVRPEEAARLTQGMVTKPGPAGPEPRPRPVGHAEHAARPGATELKDQSEGMAPHDPSRPAGAAVGSPQSRRPATAGGPPASSECRDKPAPPVALSAGQAAAATADSATTPKSEAGYPTVAAAPLATPPPAPTATIAPTSPATRPATAAVPAEPEPVVQTEMIAATKFADPEPAKRQESPGARRGASGGSAEATQAPALAGGASGAAPTTQPASTENEKLPIARSLIDANGKNLDLQTVLTRSAAGRGYNDDFNFQQQRATSQAANIASVRLQRLRIVVNHRDVRPETMLDAASTRQAEQMKTAAEKK
jgi:hypothetical protein